MQRMVLPDLQFQVCLDYQQAHSSNSSKVYFLRHTVSQLRNPCFQSIAWCMDSETLFGLSKSIRLCPVFRLLLGFLVRCQDAGAGLDERNQLLMDENVPSGRNIWPKEYCSTFRKIETDPQTFRSGRRHFRLSSSLHIGAQKEYIASHNVGLGFGNVGYHGGFPLIDSRSIGATCFRLLLTSLCSQIFRET